MTTASPRKDGPIGSHDGAPLLKVNGPTWTIHMNRPDEHNRLDPLDVDALLALLSSGLPGEVRALVITGNQSRSFSSGYTLDAITSELDGRFETMLDALETLPVLTIAAVNGNVFGGATDLALCCDIRIGQAGTRGLMPAAAIGLHYYPGGLRRYINRLGLSAASRLMLTGLPMAAEDLHRIGFYTELVEPDQIDQAIQRYTDAAQQTESTVIKQMKSHMLAIANTMQTDDRLHQQMQDAYHASVNSPALAARVSNMLNKNKKS